MVSTTTLLVPPLPVRMAVILWTTRPTINITTTTSIRNTNTTRLRSMRSLSNSSNSLRRSQPRSSSTRPFWSTANIKDTRDLLMISLSNISRTRPSSRARMFISQIRPSSKSTPPTPCPCPQCPWLPLRSTRSSNSTMNRSKAVFHPSWPRTRCSRSRFNRSSCDSTNSRQSSCRSAT